MLGDFPKHIFDLLQQQLASTGRIGATRYFVTPDIDNVLKSTQSTPVPVRFTDPGICLAMYGQEATVASQLAYANTRVRVQVGGVEDLFVDGQGGPAYMPFLAAFGTVNNWTPVLRRVTPGVDWVFTFKATAAFPDNAGAAPTIVLATISDADIARMMATHQGR